MTSLAQSLEWVFLIYFFGVNTGYLFLNISSLYTIYQYMQTHRFTELPGINSQLMPPVTIVIPAHNEEKSIVSSVRSILQLEYPDFEVIVVNDGSDDETLEELREAFDLVPWNEVYRDVIDTERVRSIFRSRTKSRLKVIDKENGGKSDSLNAGINLARTPLLCNIDADSVIERSSLKTLVRPFLLDSRTVAAGGTIRVANGCDITGGFMKKARLPGRPLALFQVVEYLRAFLFGRLGWSPINSLMIISGAFGLFDRKTLIAVGGYRNDTVSEDMEVIVRMHRLLSQEGREYRIRYIPDPICWTEVPEDVNSLRNQRIRWQQGLSESLSFNLGLCFRSGSGAVGWFGFPFMTVFEWFGPVIEVMGYVYTALGAILGFLSPYALGAFLVLSIGLGIMVSVVAFLIETISFNVYPRVKDLFLLFSAAVLENLGYRQVNSLWRLQGILRWLAGGRQSWGQIQRHGLDYRSSLSNPSSADQ